MNDFDKRRKDFDRDFDRVEKYATVFGAFVFIVSLALLGFGVWVIIALLRFFGVV